MHVQRVIRAPKRLDVVVRVRSGEAEHTSPEIAARLLAALPRMAGHVCRNEGLTFAEEAADTEVAHLFEHVTLELMALAGSSRTLEGETAWDAATDGEGVYNVSLHYDDERVCRQAIRLAEKYVRHLVDGRPAPDLDRGLERLRRAAGKSGSTKQV